MPAACLEVEKKVQQKHDPLLLENPHAHEYPEEEGVWSGES